MYIWLAHVSWVVLIAGARPVDESGAELGEGRWRERVRWGGKVVFARRVGGYWPVWRRGRKEKKTEREGEQGTWRRNGEVPHGLSRWGFTVHHCVRLVVCGVASWVCDVYFPSPSHSAVSSSSSRLKSSLQMTWDTCVVDALYFSSHYSLAALLCVSVLRLDTPSEWSLSVFGSLADCWSVRRYWGVYWHDYIGASFSAHARLLTRRVLGWQRRSAVRRGVENACVFVASGLGHAAVRFVATEGRGEVWTVAVWYAAQMVPIVVEDVVGWVWGRSGVRSGMGQWVGEGVLRRAEKAVGYLWVFAWMFWSVPTYLMTRDKWEMEGWRRSHPELFGGSVEGIERAVERSG